MNIDAVAPEQYQQQLAEKAEQMKSLFGPFSPPELEVFPSPPSHYRQRAEFRVWHEGDDIFYAMFEPGDKRRPIRLDSCPMVSERIEQTMFELLELIKPQPCLRKRLFQIDFLSTLSGELLVTLLYHRPLEQDWIDAATELQQQLSVEIIGRSRKQKLVLDHDWVVERLPLDGVALEYQQVENSFTQPNAAINIEMLNWARDVTQQAGGDLLELYCGNGNFTLALSDRFDRVLATEIAKVSVNSAHFNLERNGIDNVTIARLSSEEFTQAINKVRPFRRLREVDLDSYDFSTVLVDPPRAGLDDGTRTLVQGYQAILYISCNPETLVRDLKQLTQTHRIARLALFDQFPYTHHKESGVFLVRR
ncbi:tRNA (uridine(54)-C5)-methyltransferase TrmA [Motiliproteus coralliicola]|uniref:tRNA/tmRNA (uracil-C(5))-methyltransferase n=1 Tax=Motiliproteus coralliicola TaxID=2283196 RepID=A0A369WXH6_9GAMM|nr:tRNA (uridine(54)-C5)-methyltransferase TrmA [Motiliproteus coralliicola]RDE24215.1 tRNA (uridine(54)-C5)-methyltransferase TrmA [Motiliproteus coralliicola]